MLDHASFLSDLTFAGSPPGSPSLFVSLLSPFLVPLFSMLAMFVWVDASTLDVNIRVATFAPEAPRGQRDAKSDGERSAQERPHSNDQAAHHS
jgi:hypothetical protein